MADAERRELALAIDAQIFPAVPGWGASLAGFFVAIGLVAAFLAVGLGLPAYLPLQAASWLTFLAVVIAPGYLLGEIVTWRLDLDLLERLALALPLGVAVMALPGLVAMLGHLTLEDLAVGWTLTVGGLIAVWFIHRLLLRRSRDRSLSSPWQWIDFAMLGLLIAAFVYMFPTLSLYKMDGDAYAVATFTADALTGRPLNAVEPILGTGRSMGSIRMGMNQLLPIFHLWSYFSKVDHITLIGSASRSMLALWAMLAAYMLGKAAGGGQRRVGFLAASIQTLVYLAAPFVRADHVGIFFFERTNADKFTVSVTMLPVAAALAIYYLRSGQQDAADGPNTWTARDTWLAAALAVFAVSTIHALIAGMLALAFGAFGALHLLLNLNRRKAWFRVAGLAVLTLIVMILPLVQLVEALEGEAMAPTYPSSFEGWAVEERVVPVLPSVLTERWPTLFPTCEMSGLDIYGPLPDLAYLDAEQANTATNPFLIWRFALNMRRQRLIVFDLERYISNPTLILEPPYLLALLLMPLLLFRLRSDLGAQFCLSTSLAVLFVMFNPILTPILGSLVMPWILWRFVWLLPYALTIALAADRLLAAAIWVPTRLPWLRSGRKVLLALGSLCIVAVAAWLLLPNIRANIQEMRARGAAPLVYATPDKILDRLHQETRTGGPAMVMADDNLSVTIPAFAGNADVIAHRILSTAEMFPADQQDQALQRHIDQYDFLNTPLLTPVHIDILERYDIRYVVVPGGTSLDMQLRLSPRWFEWLASDDGYRLYAVREVPPVTASIQGNAAFLERQWDLAESHYRTALAANSVAAAGETDLLAVLGLADSYRVHGQFDLAVRTLEQALAQVDAHSPLAAGLAPILHYRLGQVYADMGQAGPSMDEYDQAQQGEPAVFSFHMALADACLSDGRIECADQQFEAAVNTLGLADQAQRLTMLGSIWQQRAEPEIALSLYEQAAEVRPDPQTQIALADVVRNAEQFERAEALLSALQQAYPPWVRPDIHLQILSAQARLKADVGEIDQAVALHRRVMRIQGLLAQDTRYTRLALAQTLLDAGPEQESRFDEARKEIDQVLSLQPHSAAAYVLLGNLYRAQYEPTQAMEAYRYALRLDPTEAAAYTSLSDQHRQQATPPDETLSLMQSAVAFNPELVILSISLADQYRRLGDVDMAIITYQQALGWFDSGSAAIAPGSFSRPQPTGRIRALAYSRLAALYEDLGQVDTAMNYYHAAITAAPDQPWTRVTLGDALRRRNEPMAAENVYRGAIQEDATQVDAYLRLAGLMYDRGASAEALALYDQALQIAEEDNNPVQSSRAWLALGSFYDQTPAVPDVLGSDEELFLEASAPDLLTGRALAAYQQSLEAEESVAGVRALARALQESGRNGEAIRLYEQRIQLGEQERWVPSLLAQYYVGLGDAHLEDLQMEKAITAFSHAIDLDGWWPGARLALARAYSEQGDLAAAQAEIWRAADIAPGSVEVQLALANSFDELGDAEQAVAIYQAATLAHPGSVPANLALARAWQERYRWELAEQSYRQALDMVPGDAEAYLGLASLYTLRARVQEAEDLLREALEIDRNNPGTYLQLGDLLARQARHTEALEVYEQAALLSESRPDLADWRSLLGLAGVWRALGEPGRAEESLLKAAEVGQNATTVSGNAANTVDVTAPLLQLSNLHQTQGQPEKAEQALLQALERLTGNVPLGTGVQPPPTADTVAGAAQARLRVRLALAEFYQSTARGEEALNQLRLAVEEDPNSMVALVSLADQLLLLGRDEEAEEVYAQAEEVQEPTVAGYLALAAARQAQQRNEEALALLDQAVALDPRDVGGWIQKGRLQMELEGPEAGDSAPGWVTSLERATELAPAAGRTWTALGDALLAATENDEDEADRLRDTAQWDMGIAALEQAIAVEPMYLPAYTALLDAYQTPGSEASSLSASPQREQIDRILAQAQSTVPGSHLIDLDRARVLEDRGSWDQARSALEQARAKAPGLPESLVALGQLEQQQGNREKAMALYGQAIDLRPGERTAYPILIDLLLAQGDNSAALTLAQEAVTRRPGDSELLLRLGRIQRILGRYTEAGSTLTSAARLDQITDRPLAELALLHEAQGQLEKAILTYDQALALNPDQPGYYLALGRLWSARGRPEHAISLLKDVLPQLPQPVPLYLAISDLHLRRGEPRLAQEILEQGIETVDGAQDQLLQALGAYYQAQADFASAEQTYRQAAGLSAADTSQANLALGRFYLSRGRATEALAEYERALEQDDLDPTTQEVPIRLALGNALRLLGRPEEAIAAYTRAIELAPRSDEAYLGLASAYRDLTRWQDAETAILQGLAIEPTSDRLLMELSNLLMQQGNEVDALELLDRAVQLSPGSRTYLARAALYRILGRPADAERDLEAARQIEPGSVEALVALGDLYRSQGDVSGAREMYRRANSLAPGIAASYIGLAELAYEQGDRNEAQWQFAAAQTAEAASPVPALSLASLYAREDEMAQAEEAYDRAIELAPASTGAYLGLADAKRQRSGSLEDIVSWLQQIESPGISRSAIYRTIGEMYRDAGLSGQTASYLEKAVELEPTSPAGHLALAELYLSEGLPEAAEPHAVQALEIAPRDPAVRIALGNIYDVLGDTDRSEGHYQEAISLDATRPDGHIALAEFFLARDDSDRAVAAYREAMRIAPLDWSLWVALGDAYAGMEKHAEALSAYEHAAEMNPSVPEPWLGQGDVRMAQKKWDAAEKAYEEAQRLRPQQAEPLLRLALLAEEREKLEKATELAQQAVELDPNSGAGYVALGRILQAREKTGKAATALMSAIQRDPRQIPAYNRWMWCYTEVKRQPYSLDRSDLKAELNKIAEGDQLGTVWAQTLLGLGYLTLEENIDQAIEHLEEAIRLDPAFAGLYQNLALANEESRDGPRALAWWQRYLKAAGRGTDTSDAEKHIENIKLVAIEAPANGEQVSGKVKIVGTAIGKYVESYKLEYRALDSEAWSSIGTGISPVKHDKLATWDTAGLAPGEYQLRLDVVRSDDDFRPWDQITVVVQPTN